MALVLSPPSSSLVEQVVTNHLLYGVSTGALGADRGNWPSLVARSLQFSSAAVEMSALSEPELPGLMDYLDTSGDLPFDFVSVHGPTKDRSDGDAGLAVELARLPASVDVIVLHPDAIEDPAAFLPLGERLVLENMDARKSTGRTVAELGACFELMPQAGFCLDVAHAWSVDQSMALAHQLLDEFVTRLTHVHLSSVTDDCEHIPLRVEDLDLFMPVLRRCIDVPWILEAYDHPLA